MMSRRPNGGDIYAPEQHTSLLFRPFCIIELFMWAEGVEGIEVTVLYS
jgi:hypothetical protein